MPLKSGISKEAFSSNVKELMDSGHSQKQSLAIAYSMKRRNKKPKGYSKGGLVDPPAGSLDGEYDLSASEQEALDKEHAGKAREMPEQDLKMLHEKRAREPAELSGKNFEGGGHEADQPEDIDHPLDEKDIVEAVMRRRMMAKGGLVLEAGSHEDVLAPHDGFSNHWKDNDGIDLQSDVDDEEDDQGIIGQILQERRGKRR